MSAPIPAKLARKGTKPKSGGNVKNAGAWIKK